MKLLSKLSIFFITFLISSYAEEQESDEKKDDTQIEIASIDSKSYIDPNECFCLIFDNKFDSIKNAIPATFEPSIEKEENKLKEIANNIELPNKESNFQPNVYFSALYIHPLEGIDHPFDLNSLKSNIKDDFTWTAAFKIGLSNDFKNAWKTSLEYTRFNSSINNFAKLFKDQSLDSFFSMNSSNIEETRNLSFNIFDLDAKRHIFTFKNVDLNTTFGIKSGFINQMMKIESLGNFDVPVLVSSTKNSSSKSNSFLIGPEIGFDSEISFKNHFKIFLNNLFSVFYQKFQVTNSMEITDEEFNDFSFSTKNSYNFLNSSFQTNLGLNYQTFIYHDSFHLDFSIGYIFEIFTNQNMMKITNDSHNNFAYKVLSLDKNLEKLIFHGLNLTLEFGF